MEWALHPTYVLTRHRVGYNREYRIYLMYNIFLLLVCMEIWNQSGLRIRRVTTLNHTVDTIRDD